MCCLIMVVMAVMLDKKLCNLVLMLILFFSIPCRGVVIKVGPEFKTVTTKVQSIPPQIIDYSYFVLEVDGVTEYALSAGGFPNINEQEAVEFHFEHHRVTLPRDIGQRFATVLKSGIKDRIYHVGLYRCYGDGSCSEEHNDLPDCPMVMSYLAFGRNNFIESSESKHTRTLPENLKSLKRARPLIKPFTVVEIASTSDPLNKYVIMHLGENLYLHWEPGLSNFFIKKAEFIDMAYQQGVAYTYTLWVEDVGRKLREMDLLLSKALSQPEFSHRVIRGNDKPEKPLYLDREGHESSSVGVIFGYPTRDADGVESYSYIH